MRGSNLSLDRFLFVIVISVTILGSACSGSSKSSPTATEIIATSTPVATPTPTCTDETAFALVGPSVARVAAGGTVASGVVVGNDLVFTSAIPVQEGDPVTVGLNGQATDGHVVAVSLGIFALIETPTLGAPAVNWGYVSALTPGRRLLALGFGPDTPGEPASSAGIFSAIRQEGALRVLETDIRFPAGTSGGPVFTQCGQVVGLAIRPDVTQDGRAIPADSAQDFLRDLERLARRPLRPASQQVQLSLSPEHPRRLQTSAGMAHLYPSPVPLPLAAPITPARLLPCGSRTSGRAARVRP